MKPGTLEQFVLDWQKADKLSDVAKKYKTPSVQAAKLRKLGVMLKKFPKGRRTGTKVDVVGLNKLIEKVGH